MIEKYGLFQTYNDTVVWCSFHPDDCSILLTYGKQHLYFWKLRWSSGVGTTGKIYRDKKSGIFEVLEPYCTMCTCVLAWWG